MKYQLEYIIWEDVFANDSWMHIDSVDDWGSGIWAVHHVGFVVKEDKKRIVLSSVMALIEEPGSERLAAKYCIPKRSIIKRIKLKTPKI